MNLPALHALQAGFAVPFGNRDVQSLVSKREK